MSVIAPVCAPSVPSVHPSNNEHQKILDKFPSTNYGEKFPSETMVKISDHITLALHQAKFREKTPGNSQGGISW